MKRRIILPAIGVAALAAGSAAWPQKSKPTSRRLGILLLDRPEIWAFFGPELRKEFARLGWIEGSNLTLEWRFAEGDAGRLPALAAATSRSGVDAILTRGTPATRALQQATKTVPILTGLGDPIGEGFAQSLAHPGGNITGISYALAETSRKQVELLREMLPRLTRLTIIMKSDQQAFANKITQAARSAAQESRITSRIVIAGSAVELRNAIQPRGETGTDAALVYGLGTSIEPVEIAAILLRAMLPGMFDQREYVDAGGLMSYRLNWENQTQRTVAQIDKVFRGESPAQIPFEFPTRSELIINAKTAKALGMIVPQTLVARADQVVE
jgi:putative tryptophan/tyrosine transport system substrate-binding protein